MTNFLFGMASGLGLLLFILTIWSRGAILLILVIATYTGISKLFGRNPWV